MRYYMDKAISPITKFSIAELAYKHWVRDIILSACRTDKHLFSLIELLDDLFDFKKGGD